MQSARVYLNATGEIIHVATSTAQITTDHIESSDIVESYDMEVGDDALPFKRAKELLNNLEVKDGKPAFKAIAPPGLTAANVRKVAAAVS